MVAFQPDTAAKSVLDCGSAKNIRWEERVLEIA